MVASPLAKVYNFKTVDMPMKRFKEHSYTILDTSEGQVFIQINHHGPDAHFGNIYISDKKGVVYSFSLENNVRDVEGQCEFVKVQALEGIYIANTFTQEHVKEYKTLFGGDNNKHEMDVMEAFNDEKHKHSNTHKRQEFELEMYKHRQTVMSFDKGGMWQNVAAPKKDSKGKLIKCKNEDCSLHLNSVSDMTYGPLYSPKNALGMVLATGNVGMHLSMDAKK